MVDLCFPYPLPGEAEAILAKAQATAKGIEVLSDTIKASGGVEVRDFCALDCKLDPITHWHCNCRKLESSLVFYIILVFAALIR